MQIPTSLSREIQVFPGPESAKYSITQSSAIFHADVNHGLPSVYLGVGSLVRTRLLPFRYSRLQLIPSVSKCFLHGFIISGESNKSNNSQREKRSSWRQKLEKGDHGSPRVSADSTSRPSRLSSSATRSSENGVCSVASSVPLLGRLAFNIGRS